MLVSLNNPSHAENYRHAAAQHRDISPDRDDLTRMFEALDHVSRRQYPVSLFGREVGFRAFKITTAESDSLLDGDWAIQFFFSSEQDRFHFSIWKGAPRGVLAMPQRVCSRADFEDAIGELISQMADGALGFDSE